MADNKSATAMGAREAKKAEAAGLVSRVLHVIGNIAEIAGGYMTITNPLAGLTAIGSGIVIGKAGDAAEAVKSSHEGKSHADDALLAMARGGSAALGMHGVVPPSSLASRVMQKMGQGADAGSVSAARVGAGQQAASREQHREATPIANEAPAVTPNAAPVATGAPHTHHGWTDAARAASAQARGVRWGGGN